MTSRKIFEGLDLIDELEKKKSWYVKELDFLRDTWVYTKKWEFAKAGITLENITEEITAKFRKELDEFTASTGMQPRIDALTKQIAEAHEKFDAEAKTLKK